MADTIRRLSTGLDIYVDARVAARELLKVRGARAIAYCPCCPDAVGSLFMTWKLVRTHPDVLAPVLTVHCQRGCRPEDVMAALLCECEAAS